MSKGELSFFFFLMKAIILIKSICWLMLLVSNEFLYLCIFRLINLGISPLHQSYFCTHTKKGDGKTFVDKKSKFVNVS